MKQPWPDFMWFPNLMRGTEKITVNSC